MSFIPGSGAGVVQVLGGQGITTSGNASVVVSANLSAGPGIVLGNGPGGSVQITAAGPTGNVTAVGTSNGAGIQTSFDVGTGVVTLDRGLFNPATPGSGILLTESTSNAELYISNAQSVDSLKGGGSGSSNATGIIVTPYVSGVNKTFGVSANLQAGSGISITPTSALPSNSGLTITNTGVTSVTAGNFGIAIGGTPQAPTISNNGIWNVAADVGIAIVPGPSLQVPAIQNTGVLTVTGGTGISVTGASQTPTVTNTGVTSIVAGSGITVSGSTGAVTVSSSAVSPGGYILNSQAFNASPSGITLNTGNFDIPVTVPAGFAFANTLMNVVAHFNDVPGNQDWSALNFSILSNLAQPIVQFDPLDNSKNIGAGKVYKNIYFPQNPSTITLRIANNAGPVSGFCYSIQVEFVLYQNPVMNYNSTGVATQSPPYVQELTPGDAPIFGGSFSPTPANNNGVLPTSIVPMFWNSATNSIVLPTNPLIRFFRVNTPSPVGSPQLITDPQGNSYPNTDWLLTLSGFANNGVDRTYGVTLLPQYGGVQNWYVIYNQAGGTGIVWVVAINKALFCSVQY